MERWYVYVILFSGWIVSSCANIIPLEGGSRDTTPPKLIKAMPDTFSLQFKTKKISLYFDEFVVISNASQEVFLSPPMKTKPELILKGRSVDIVLQDTLLPNTTYIIRFGKAIADNNEGNVAHNLSYVFSTGSFIDSLSLQFKVINAFTLKPVEGVTILLYNQQGDSLPYKTDPYYIGESNSTGYATLSYLSGGDYNVFALKESNLNLRYDRAGEWIGFMDQSLQSGDSVVYRILLFKEENKRNTLRFARMIHPGKICFVFQSPADSIRIEPITDSLPGFASSTEFGSDEHDSLLYWYKPIKADTLLFRVLQNGVWDTVTVRKSLHAAGSGSKGKGAKPTVSSSEMPVFEIKRILNEDEDFTLPIKFILSSPIDKVRPDLASLKQDDKSIALHLSFTDSLKRNLSVEAKLEEGKTYTLILLPQCLTDLFGNSHDTLIFRFKTALSSDFHNVSLQIEHIIDTRAVVLQWMDDKEKILLEQSVVVNEEGLTKINFSRIREGKYTLRMIYDANQNGTWDTGCYDKRIQPEKVSYYPQVIEVKKGFDLNLNWDIGKASEAGKSVK
ncbi:MAG: Ig-like domain-containing protein [Flavobacteriales bacterium]|nr:Ig-like domain-containing protein [Flavobacteriales bacterium]